MLLTSDRYKPRVLLNSPQCMDSPSPNSTGSLALKVNSAMSEEPGCRYRKVKDTASKMALGSCLANRVKGHAIL